MNNRILKAYIEEQFNVKVFSIKKIIGYYILKKINHSDSYPSYDFATMKLYKSLTEIINDLKNEEKKEETKRIKLVEGKNESR